MYIIWTVGSFDQIRTKAYQSELKKWGTEYERKIYKSFKIVKRRREWLLGRLYSKYLIQHYYKERFRYRIPFKEIEIRNESSGKPVIYILKPGLKDHSLHLTLSISHSNEHSFCALLEHEKEIGFGVDIEKIESRPPLFGETFLHHDEIIGLDKCCVNEMPTALTAMWSLKEAFLKALGIGLRFDTKKIKTGLTCLPWSDWEKQQISVVGGPKKNIEAQLKQSGNYVLSIVTLGVGLLTPEIACGELRLSA